MDYLYSIIRLLKNVFVSKSLLSLQIRTKNETKLSNQWKNMKQIDKKMFTKEEIDKIKFSI